MMNNLRVVGDAEPESEPKPETKSENKALSTALESCPEPPEWMSFEAKLEWMRTGPDLFASGKVITPKMLGLLENYCVAIGLARDMNLLIENDGQIVQGKPHPGIKIMMDAMRDARSAGIGLRLMGDAKLSDEDKLGGWDDELLA